MAEKDPKIEAVETVYTALKPLNQQQRQEVVTSVFALFGSPVPAAQGGSTTPTGAGQPAPGATAAPRPKGLMEVMQERHPATNPERITVFAYYRERHENIARFSREDLKGYFGKAHLKPPERNYDRDFNKALQRGWLHENEAESYITTKGIEAVENGFEGERFYNRRTKGAKKAKSAKPQQRRKAKS